MYRLNFGIGLWSITCVFPTIVKSGSLNSLYLFRDTRSNRVSQPLTAKSRNPIRNYGTEIASSTFLPISSPSMNLQPLRNRNVVHRHEPPVTSTPVKVLYHDVEREFLVVDKPGSIVRSFRLHTPFSTFPNLSFLKLLTACSCVRSVLPQHSH